MEETGLPKRNIALAIALSILVYIVWFSFLPKKKTGLPAKSASQTLTTLPTELPEEFSEVSFGDSQTSGKVLLDNSAPLSQLFSLEPKRKVLTPTLLAGSRFLATNVEVAGSSFWRLKETRPDGLTLELPLGEENVLIKEFRTASANGDLGTLRLHYASVGNKALEINLEIEGKVASSKDDKSQNFAGYRGRKGRIIHKPKSKETHVLEELAPGKPLDALGVSSRYSFAVVSQISEKKFLNIKRNPQTNSWICRLSLNPQESIEIPFYVGFKNDAILKRLHLENLLYGGWLGPVKRLIHIAMSFFYRLTGNYGLAIIMLTIVFQSVLLPFTLKNLKLTQKMKELSPKVKVIQEKYKNDPKKMQVEMMQTYRSHGANPLGGCLLLLPQMPIFIALYTALNENYDLYGAPFILWIKNLAAPDSTYVLPLLMGAVMFFQTKLTQTSSVDPSQKIMSYLMPAVFTFMFLRFPSGLVLYWLTSNVISLIFSVVLPKLIDRRA